MLRKDTLHKKAATAYQVILVAVAPLIALALGVGFALARPDIAAPVSTVLLHGKSELAGQELPVTLGAMDLTEDGLVRMVYEYNASGEATGGYNGPFEYMERGYIFMDPETGEMVGNQFTGASFTLYPDKGPAVTVEDSCVTCYEHAHEMSQAAPNWASDVMPLDPPYGYFTFTTSQGTFKGYATPDFGEFVIQVGFHRSEATPETGPAFVPASASGRKG